MAGRKKSAKRLRPPERFTVDVAAEVFAAGARRIAAGKSLRIDLSEVLVVDTAALQCLAVLHGAALDRDIACSIVGATAAVVDSAELLGLNGLFQVG